MQRLIKIIGPVLREALAERDTKIQSLEQHIAALEARPQMQDKGVWRPGEFYQPGDIVSRAGSAWSCQGSHMAGDDFSHDHFRLLVKRGRDGKDAR